MTTEPIEPTSRTLRSATILSIGAELTVGDTRDTNAPELARALTAAGVTVERLSAVPDRLPVVSEAFAASLERSDLVLSTGGLGPTPDDLTREAIAAVCGETPTVDPTLERWLRALWRRRGLPFPEINRKQAWLIPSAVALPNPNGTAPGWFVTRPDGRVMVAMPGPPREMRPMWTDEALPRLRARGLGTPFATRTYRTFGIGESQIAELLGEAMLRTPNPEVATYARADAVDVRVSAVDAPGPDGVARPADAWLADVATVVESALGERIWAMGDTTWSGAIGSVLEGHGWRMASVERETAGQFAGLLGDVPWLALAESWTGTGVDAETVEIAVTPSDEAALAVASEVRERAGVAVGVAVLAAVIGSDTITTIAVVAPGLARVERRTAFLGGSLGRTRAALAAASVVLEQLRSV